MRRLRGGRGGPGPARGRGLAEQVNERRRTFTPPRGEGGPPEGAVSPITLRLQHTLEKLEAGLILKQRDEIRSPLAIGSFTSARRDYFPSLRRDEIRSLRRDEIISLRRDEIRSLLAIGSFTSPRQDYFPSARRDWFTSARRDSFTSARQDYVPSARRDLFTSRYRLVHFGEMRFVPFSETRFVHFGETRLFPLSETRFVRSLLAIGSFTLCSLCRAFGVLPGGGAGEAARAAGREPARARGGAGE
eukprot:51267-Prorocentrum_minimum.AAC.2